MASTTQILRSGTSTINGDLEISGGLECTSFFYNDTTPLTPAASAPVAWTPDIIEYNTGTFTSILAGTPTKIGEYYQVGKMIYAQAYISWSSLAATTATEIGIPLPVTATSATPHQLFTTGIPTGFNFNTGAGDTNDLDASFRLMSVVRTGTVQDRLELRVMSETQAQYITIQGTPDVNVISIKSSGTLNLAFAYEIP